MLPSVQSLVTTCQICSVMHALVYVISSASSMLLMKVHLLFYIFFVPPLPATLFAVIVVCAVQVHAVL